MIRRAGGVVKLAAAVKRHHSTILGWNRVPPEHVKAVSAATDVPPHELRPDLWDPPSVMVPSTGVEKPRSDAVGAAKTSSPTIAARDPAVDEAIEAAGGERALAGKLGIKLASLSAWRSVPALRVLAVEAATGIPRTRLRPDLYPSEEKNSPEDRQRVA